MFFVLTKTDLSKIRAVLREEIESEGKSLKEDLRGEIKLTRIELQKEIHSLADRIKNLEITADKIQKDTQTIVGFFDAEYLKIRARVERIESFVNLPPSQS